MLKRMTNSVYPDQIAPSGDLIWLYTFLFMPICPESMYNVLSVIFVSLAFIDKRCRRRLVNKIYLCCHHNIMTGTVNGVVR